MAYILIIDDDEDFASALANVLADGGYELEYQLTTSGGIKSIEKRRPDLIVLDVMFPESETAGFDMARLIRKSYPSIPIVMLTAINQRVPLGFGNDDIDETWLPIVEFIEKPVDLNVVRDKVNGILAKHA